MGKFVVALTVIGVAFGGVFLFKSNHKNLSRPVSAVEGKPYFGTTSAFGGELMVIAGGFPVKQGNSVVGAVGVGGSADVSQDVECAKAALEVLEKA